MDIERRFAPCEFRAGDSGSPGTLSGVVVRYGDLAQLPGFRERILAGAFGDLERASAIVNFQHERARPLARQGRGLTLTDGPDALRAAVRLPDTQDGRDAATLFREDVLRGFSVEFRVKQQAFDSPGLRTIRAAVFHGFGLVDKPAYGDSLAQIAARAAGAPGETPGQTPGAHETRGARLAAVLAEAIEQTGAETSTLAEAAGIDESTVRQILRGEIEAPPLRRLQGFARVLSVDVDKLVSAAEADGGEYRASCFPDVW